MPSAIVTGATGTYLLSVPLTYIPALTSTGILGREIVTALGNDPATWQVVHALSRSQKEKYPPSVRHDTIDLTGDAEEMAKQLQGVEAEYVFFAAYLQKDSEQENWDVNGRVVAVCCRRIPSRQLTVVKEPCSETSSRL